VQGLQQAQAQAMAMQQPGMQGAAPASLLHVSAVAALWCQGCGCLKAAELCISTVFARCAW
jgi:hypothetical protein